MILRGITSLFIVPISSFLVPGLALGGWAVVVVVIVVHAAQAAILVVRNFLLDKFSSSTTTTFGSACTAVGVG